MNINEVKPNSRIQVDVERGGRASLDGESNLNATLDTYRGIVMEVSLDKIILVTDFGREVHIFKDDILSIAKVVLDKNVSQSVMKLKSFYLERRELILRMQKLVGREERLIENLLDANMLSRFNLLGAKNRMQKSINPKLLEFNRGLFLYNVSLHVGEKDRLEVRFRVSNVLEHYHSEVNVDSLIRTHAPQEKELLEKVFSSIGEVEEQGHSVVHVDGTLYEVISQYRLRFEVSKENYVEMRTAVANGLRSLRK